MALLTAALYFMRPLLPFTAGMEAIPALALALVMGVTLTAQSPAVVVALRNEIGSDGPLTRTVLGVVVLSDLAVILCFALASFVARPFLESGGSAALSPALLVWEILGSLGAGLLIGGLIAVFLRSVRTSGALFVVTVGFLVAEVGQRVHLDPLLIALAAGMLIRNATSHGDRLHADIEAASLPVYISFFAVAGATIQLDAFRSLGIPAAILAVIRAAGFLGGTAVAGKAAGSPAEVRRYAGLGLLSQAGLALALALLFERGYPQFGAPAATLILGVVGLNQIVGPVLYRWALVRSGEAGKLRSHPEEQTRPIQEKLAEAGS
jgi:Kef-type K+ transport system membrane component KefB